MDGYGVGAHVDGDGVRTRVRARLRRAEASVPGLGPPFVTSLNPGAEEILTDVVVGG